MSFTFDGAGDRLTGTLTSTYAGPVTLAAFIKVTAHPVAVDAILELGNSNSATADSFAIGTGSTDDTWRVRSTDATPTSSFAATAAFNVDGVWAGIVGVFTSSTLRDVYIQSIGQTAQNTQARTVAGVLKYIAVGENLANGADFTGKIAELAIWNAALTTQQITDYLAGVQASTIAAANLIEYVSMSTNSLLNLGLDADGDLTAVGNAVFDSDHPVITGGSSANSRMLLMGVG